MRKLEEEKMDSALDDYMEAVLKCQNVERKIKYLMNFGSLCYDYNQPDHASKAYKLALDLCLANEDGLSPRFKDHAVTAARSIQFLANVCAEQNSVVHNEQQIVDFYNQKFDIM